MELYHYPFTEAFIKNDSDGQVILLFLDRSNLHEALIFIRFSFYIINIGKDINLDHFRAINLVNEQNTGSDEKLYIESIRATDINDIVYIKINNGNLLILTHTFDNYTGASYQYLRIFTSENKGSLTPQGTSEYDKFSNDSNRQNPFDVVDLRLK